MAYRGIPVFKQDELTSVRRMRESGMFKLPDGSGFFTGTVGTKEAGTKGMKWGQRKREEKAGEAQHRANQHAVQAERHEKASWSSGSPAHREAMAAHDSAREAHEAYAHAISSGTKDMHGLARLSQRANEVSKHADQLTASLRHG